VSEPLARRTSTQVGAAPGRILLVPIGSFEQHGPHLPLATDTMLAEAVCADVAAVRDVDVAPAVNYSASGEHAGFSGLLSIGVEATVATLRELVRSARASWSGVLLVCAHGGNATAIAEVEALARAEGDNVGAWCARDPGGDAHAGMTETSVMLHVAGDLVRVELAPEAVRPAEGWQDVLLARGVAAVSDSGVIGAPREASAAAGAEIMDRWCGEVVEMIDRLSKR
jgi:creatinine amidohydrolase